MHIRYGLAITLLAWGLLASFSGCAEGDTDTPTGTTSAGTTTTGTTTTGTATGGGTTTGTGGGTGGMTPTGGGPYDPCPEVGATHLLISEIATNGPFGSGGTSAGGNYEFIEIWNPTGSAVDLSKYYLSDNGAYFRIAQGQPFTIDDTDDTDFITKFPAGAQLDANDVVVIQAGPDFESAWGLCPDYAVGTDTPPSCGGGTVPLMEVPTYGKLGADAGRMLSNDREMVVLFCWDGNSTIVKDVDYLPYGDTTELRMRIDKTGEPGYQPDTAPASQQAAPDYAAGGGGGPDVPTLGRCDADEDGETQSNGNGPAGHDETSENCASSFQVQTDGSPGAVNPCN